MPTACSRPLDSSEDFGVGHVQPWAAPVPETDSEGSDASDGDGHQRSSSSLAPGHMGPNVWDITLSSDQIAANAGYTEVRANELAHGMKAVQYKLDNFEDRLIEISNTVEATLTALNMEAVQVAMNMSDSDSLRFREACVTAGIVASAPCKTDALQPGAYLARSAARSLARRSPQKVDAVVASAPSVDKPARTENPPTPVWLGSLVGDSAKNSGGILPRPRTSVGRDTCWNDPD